MPPDDDGREAVTDRDVNVCRYCTRTVMVGLGTLDVRLVRHTDRSIRCATIDADRAAELPHMPKRVSRSYGVSWPPDWIKVPRTLEQKPLITGNGALSMAHRGQSSPNLYSPDIAPAGRPALPMSCSPAQKWGGIASGLP